MNMSGMDFYGRDVPAGEVMEVRPPHLDVGVFEYLVHGKMNDFVAYEDELEEISS